MNYSKESLAHESGLELDDFYADNNNLTKADLQFECSKCGTISTGFINKVCDEDIWGLCSNCKGHRILIDLSKEAQS